MKCKYLSRFRSECGNWSVYSCKAEKGLYNPALLTQEECCRSQSHLQCPAYIQCERQKQESEMSVARSIFAYCAG